MTMADGLTSEIVVEKLSHDKIERGMVMELVGVSGRTLGAVRALDIPSMHGKLIYCLSIFHPASSRTGICEWREQQETNLRLSWPPHLS